MNEDHHRVFWHSRRGMLELDLLLVPFVERHYDALSNQDKETYRRLLTREDQDLFSWFMKNAKPVDDELRAMIDLILEKRP